MRSLPLLALTLTIGLGIAPVAAQQTATPSTAGPAPTWPEDYPPGAGTELGARIATLLNSPAVSNAHWGIAVTAMDGTPLFGLDQNKLFRPASTAKLFTTITAIALLGPEKRFTTRVLAQGPIANGTLSGNLVLVGQGDPTFASGYALPFAYSASTEAKLAPDPLSTLNDFAAKIAAQGITHINGDIIGDDRFFEWNPYPEGWAYEDILWGYGAPATALTFHDNQLRLTLAAAPNPGTPTSASFDLNLPFYKVDNSSLTSSDNDPAVLVTRNPGSNDVVISGTVPSRIGAFHTSLAIDDPAAYAALALKAVLQQHGIAVTGTARAEHSQSRNSASFNPRARISALPAMIQNLLQQGVETHCTAQQASGDPAPPNELATYSSVPLLQDVILTAKISENTHAEDLLLNVAAAKDCEHTLRRAVAWQREFLLNIGLAPDDFLFYDGSGLSAKDLVTPRAEVQLLAYAAKQPWFPQWKSALPIGGVDGTLDNRFKDSPLKGHVFAKTGTLGESRALAGYLDCASGHQVIFSIMVDNHELGTSVDRTTMDKIVEAIAAAN